MLWEWLSSARSGALTLPSASDFVELATLNIEFGASPWPTAFGEAVWLALYYTPPSDSGGGAEVTGHGYRRVPISRGDEWSLADAGRVTAARSRAFPMATSNYSSAVNAFGLFDAETSGNLLFWNNLAAPITVTSGKCLLTDDLFVSTGGVTPGATDSWGKFGWLWPGVW